MKENVKYAKDKTIERLLNDESYDMQTIFDSLYKQSKEDCIFIDLKNIILSEANILLAYKNIKQSVGKTTAGIDGLTIKDIAKLSQEEVIQKVNTIVTGKNNDYIPKSIRRKDVKNLYETSKSLYIPCIWDRLIQQCIYQVLEPICEAKYSQHNYGFRPGRYVQHAIGDIKKRIEISHMYYAVDFNLERLFDAADHQRLISKIWAFGIHDKWLIYMIKKILKTHIRLENGSEIIPAQGVSQCGMLSTLLINVMLTEFDKWVESQWEENPVLYKYKLGVNPTGTPVKSHGYLGMRRKTTLKEMYIVRYSTRFCVFTNSRENAERILIASTDWLSNRLRFYVVQDEANIVDLKKAYIHFLDFKFKAERKEKKFICKSHIDDQALKRCEHQLKAQIIKVATPIDQKAQFEELTKYNAMVMGIQNYYKIATCVNFDLNSINRRMARILRNRFGDQLTKTGPIPKGEIGKIYGRSKMLRYIKGINEPIIPIGYVRHKWPNFYKQNRCFYTVEGREELQTQFPINYSLLHKISCQKLYGRTIEYMDNRISLFFEQKGKCAVTGVEFSDIQEIHCHHKVPKSKGGTDEYQNLILINKAVHFLIHATQTKTINKYLAELNLDDGQIDLINSLRLMAGLKKI